MRIITKLEGKPTLPIARKRVAAYARVSSGKDAMLHSLSAQISYYNDYIGQRRDWEFAGVYADEARTGTKDTRPEFQRLLADCRAGKIDMVIAKSITRFARNTVTLLEAVRELKLREVEVVFEKENIHTLSAEGEVLLTLLASFAQEESRSASENVKWRIRRMFAEGRPNQGRMLGYRMFDGQLYIIPQEADLVRKIFADYLSGMGLTTIMKKLNRSGVTTINNNKWRVGAVRDILHNEKYTGDMLLQKTYVVDHLTKRKLDNRGALPKYHVKNSHEAIIDKNVYQATQLEMTRRAELYSSKPPEQEQYLFTGMLRCDRCGKNYRRKIIGFTPKAHKPIWICPTFNDHGRDVCPSQQIPENILIKKTQEIIGTTELDIDTLRQHISVIHIPAHNRLVYVFTDGHTEEVSWHNPSRRESWTPEMKQKARERQLALIKERNQ